MRKATKLVLFFLAEIAVAIDTSPFLAPYTEEITYNGFALNLFRREGNCGSGVSCAAMGDPGSCCMSKSHCAVDQAGHVACCPLNAKCTGTIGRGAFATATNTGNAAGAAQVTSNGDEQIVSNRYYAFPYAPTSFPNRVVCSSSYSSCKSEFIKCTYTLESGDNGVTVSGAGVGVTRQPALPDVTAASICSSLSTQACHNLQLASCATYGTGAATAAGSFGVSGGGAMPTGCPEIYRVGMGVGVALGIAGQMVA